MNKKEYLNDLDSKLNFLPEDEREKTLNYYSEMIDDRIESGMDEEKAISKLESANAIANQLKSEHSTQQTTSEKVFNFIDKLLTKHGYLFLLIIIILSFPVWIPIVGGILTFVGIIFLLLFALIALGSVVSIVSLCAAISFITQSLLSTISTLGVSMIFAGFTMLITIGTFKLINIISNFCKETYKSIKNHQEKRRNSK